MHACSWALPRAAEHRSSKALVGQADMADAHIDAHLGRMLMHELDEAGDEEGRRENEHLDLPSSRSPRRAESEMRTAAETVALARSKSFCRRATNSASSSSVSSLHRMKSM